MAVSQAYILAGVQDAETTLVNTAIPIDVTANDYSTDTPNPDGSGEPNWTKLQVRSTPTNGTADNGTPTDESDDYIDYTPNANFVGTDTFVYRVEDANNVTNETTVTVEVIAPLDAIDDTATTDEDQPVKIEVLDNDVDPALGIPGPGGIEPTIDDAGFTQPANGTVELKDNGTPGDPTDDFFVYTPNDNYNNTAGTQDTFTYTVVDTKGTPDTADDTTETATVSVLVNPVNDLPVAEDDTFTGTEDTQVTGSVFDNNGNGVDYLQDAAVTVTAFDATSAEGGTVVVNPDGTFTYDPAPGFNGEDTFTYTITDADEETDTATVTINLVAVNDVPLAVDDTATTPENIPVNIPVRDNDTTVDGTGGDDPTNITSVTQPTDGTVRIRDNSTPLDPTDDFVEYTPNRGFAGTDTFTYTITDDDGETSTATVDVTINDAPNDAPIAVNDAKAINISRTLEAGEDLVFNDEDPNNDPLTILQIANSAGVVETNGTVGLPGQYGTLVWSEGGTEADYEVDPDNPAVAALAIGETLTEVYTYTLQDENGATDTATYTITLNKENAPPKALNDEYLNTNTTGTTVFANILTNDSDPDPGQTVSILTVSSDGQTFDVSFGTPFTLPSGATATINPDGTVTYDPTGGTGASLLDPLLAQGSSVVDVFQYKVGDGNTVGVGGEPGVQGVDYAEVKIVTYGNSPIDDPPILDLDTDNSSGALGNKYTTTFTEGGAGVAIGDTDVAISDVDSPNMESAIIRLVDAPDGAEESLSFDPAVLASLGITGTYDAATRTVTLTGSATVANYQAAIAGITYNNTSLNPDVANRKVEVKVSDRNGTVNFTTQDGDSNLAVTTIKVVAINEPPIVDSNVISVIPDAVDEPLALEVPTDADGDNLTITVTEIPTLGTITLADGTPVEPGDTLTPEKLAGLQYDAPTTAEFDGSDPGDLVYTVNDGKADPVTGTVDIQISNPPVIDLDGNDDSGAIDNAYTHNFVTGSGAVPIGDIDVAITDVDDANMESAVITLTNILQPDTESLSINGTLPTGITASAYDPVAGTITLTGSATIADYQTAINQIVYDNTSGTPDRTDRLVNVTVNDGVTDSNTAVATITYGNAPPVIDLDGDDSSGAIDNAYTGNFTVGDPPVPIGDIDVNITDADDVNMDEAVITLTNPINGAEESLSISGTLPAGITASAYDPVAGTISLTGSAPITDYQTAINQIVYENVSGDPDRSDRLVNVTVNDGDDNSNTAVSTITFGDAPPVIDLDADDSSGVAGNDYTNNFIPGGNAVTIGDIDTDVTDVDDVNMESATITLTNILNGDAESLTVGTLPAGITASAYDPVAGTITLSGSAPIADYQAAIAGITYNNTATLPNQADRVIDVKVNDGEKDSNTAVSTITFGDAPPVIDLDADDSSGVAGNDYTNNFIPGGNAVTIGDIDTDVTDVDDVNMESATITLTNILNGDAESLTVGTLPAGITASAYDPATGTITLSGSAPIADYQAAIAGITYNNTATLPNQADRVIDVKVNDGEKDSNVAVSTITFGDAPPVIDLDADDSSGVAGNDYTNNFVPGATPVTIGDIDTDVTDVDDVNMESATITLTNILNGDAESLTVGTLPAGITASAYDPVAGTITLSGSAPIADYQAAIAGITYNNTATLPNQADRVIDVKVNDGEKDSNVAVSTITFGDAPPVIDLDGDDSSGVAGNDYTNNFVPGATPVTIGDIDTDVTDVDDVNMESATITPPSWVCPCRLSLHCRMPGMPNQADRVRVRTAAVACTITFGDALRYRPRSLPALTPYPATLAHRCHVTGRVGAYPCAPLTLSGSAPTCGLSSRHCRHHLQQHRDLTEPSRPGYRCQGQRR